MSSELYADCAEQEVRYQQASALRLLCHGGRGFGIGSTQECRVSNMQCVDGHEHHPMSAQSAFA